MGGVVGSPIDDAKQQEIKDLIEAVLKTFTLQYTKAYGIALLKKIKADVTAKPEGWRLLQRPKDGLKEPLKEGYLIKQGAVRKNWLKRYFVVRPDYKIEYYESKEAYEAKKQPKGVIAPCGYSVKMDVQKDLLDRLQEIAEKMGAQVADLPQPEKMPDHCIEIHHYRRRCYFIHGENEEEKKEWAKVFKQCAWYCWGFENDDPVANAAFKEAIRRTRWELGRWGYWSYGGTETQILTDLIVDELNYTILGDIYYNLKGPWPVRWKLRNQLLKILDTMVSSAVAPALKAMETAIKTLRGRIEGMIREKIEPIFKAEEEVQDKIKDATMETIGPTMSEKVSPRLAGIIQILISPMTDAFQETRSLFHKRLEELTEKVEKEGFGPRIDAHFRALDYTPHQYWSMRPAFDKVDVMEDPLWVLRQFFDDIHPWSLIYKAHDSLKMILDNAFYTFEQELIKAVEDTPAKTDGAAAKAAIEKCRESVQEQFSADAAKVTIDYYKDIMMSIVMPFLQKIVNPVCKPLLEPVQSAIPDAFTDIIDVEEMFDKVLDKIVGAAIDKVVDHVTSPPAEGD